MKGKLIILEGQIAVKMKENDARGKQKVDFFSGAPSGAQKSIKSIDFE